MPDRAQAHRGHPGDWIAPALLSAAVFASVPYFVHPWFDFHQDATTYIITARSLAEGEGYTFLGSPFALRPPGLSALLAPIIAARGTDFLALNLAVLSFGAVGAILLYYYARPRLGIGLAVLVAGALWLSPSYQRLATRALSDAPGLTLLLGCLLLDRWAARRPSWRRELVLGLAIGASAYVRALTLLLLPAVALARFLAPTEAGSTRPRAGGWLAGVLALCTSAALVQLPWVVRNQLHPAPSPADQTLVYDYWTGMWHEDPGDPDSPLIALSDVAQRAVPRVPELLESLGNRLRSDDPTPVADAYGALLIASLGIALFRRREPGELFALAVLAVLAIYFAYEPRLALPVYVLACVAAVESLRDGVARVAGRRAGVAVAALLPVALIAADFAPRKDWARIERSHSLLSLQASALAAALPPGATLASYVGRNYQVFLERPVYSLRWGERRTRKWGMRVASVASAHEALIDKYGVDTVLLSSLDRREAALVPSYSKRYEDMRQVGPVYVIRVRPPPAATRAP